MKRPGQKCLTDVYVDGELSYHASYDISHGYRYFLKNTSNEEVGIGTVNPESFLETYVKFQLSDGSSSANLKTTSWRSKFEIQWKGEPVLLSHLFLRRKQQIPNSSINFQTVSRWTKLMSELVITGEESDFREFNPTLLIGLFYYIYANAMS